MALTPDKSTPFEITLRVVEFNELLGIQTMAQSVWPDYYTPIIGAQQVHYMLKSFYSLESLQAQFSNQHVFYWIYSHLPEAIGFLSVEQLQPHQYKIHKFYLIQSHAQQGIGSLAFNRLRQELTAHQIELTVNRFNYKAINFYFKNGFRIASLADFDIGNGFVMNDFIMQWRSSQMG